MESKAYKNKICSRCLNKYNDKDLCNIAQTIDGSFECKNKKLLQVGEFIRTDKGLIFQIDEENKNLVILKFLDAKYGKITKHSFSLRDLIEEGDIINKQRVYWEDEVGELVVECSSDINGFQTFEDIEIYDDGIETLLTKEQYEENCYTVKGRNKRGNYYE